MNGSLFNSRPGDRRVRTTRTVPPGRCVAMRGYAVADTSALKMISLERAKFLRRDEQALLPGGGSNDVQPAQVAGRVDSDDQDHRPHRLESAESRRLTLRRPIQTLLADFIEEG